MSAAHKAAQQRRRAGERLLKMLKETGPRSINVCVGLVGQEAFDHLRENKRIRVVGKKRGARWAAA